MIGEFLQWMGFGLCHQLPERSFAAGGVQVPVCARDTGIYLGFVAAFALIALVHRPERPRGFPRAHVWAVMAAFLLLMAVDGLSSYSSLRTTTNQLRLATGLGVGFSAAAIVFPMLQDVVWRRADRQRVLDPVWRFAVWLVALPVVYAAVWWGAPALGIAYPLGVAAAIVFTLGAINLVMLGMLPAFDRKAERLTDLLAPVALAILVAFGEIAVAGWVRSLLEGVSRAL